MMEAKDIIQTDATMIVGIFVFYTIPYLARGYMKGMERLYSNIVLYCIALAVISFAIAVVSAIISNFVYNDILMGIAEYGTIIGFVLVAVAIASITKIAKPIEELFSVMKWGPEPSGSRDDKK